MKRSLFAFLALLVLTACAVPVVVVSPDSPGRTPLGSAVPSLPSVPNPYAPQPGDDALLRGDVYPDSAQVLTLESFPVQIVLNLKGNLPDPCHQLRVVVGQPDGQNRIAVDVYSVTDPDKVCAQVLAPFEANVNLGSFQTGHYTIWVNGEQVGEFDA